MFWESDDLEIYFIINILFSRGSEGSRDGDEEEERGWERGERDRERENNLDHWWGDGDWDTIKQIIIYD